MVKSESLRLTFHHYTISIPYGGKLWQWENLANSPQKVIGGIKFGEFAMYVRS